MKSWYGIIKTKEGYLYGGAKKHVSIRFDNIKSAVNWLNDMIKIYLTVDCKPSSAMIKSSNKKPEVFVNNSLSVEEKKTRGRTPSLSQADKEDIKRLYFKEKCPNGSSYTLDKLARMFKVSETTIANALKD